MAAEGRGVQRKDDDDFSEAEWALITKIFGEDPRSDGERRTAGDHVKEMLLSLTTVSAEDAEDYPKTGGRWVSEEVDDFYQRLVVANLCQEQGQDEDDEVELSAQYLRFLKGLHRTPAIACSSVEGVVSIDLEAARSHLEKYFDVVCRGCEPAKFPGGVNPGGLSRNGVPFWFHDDFGGEDAAINYFAMNAASLAAFRNHHLSLRRPLFAPYQLQEREAECSGRGRGGRSARRTEPKAIDLPAHTLDDMLDGHLSIDALLTQSVADSRLTQTRRRTKELFEAAGRLDKARAEDDAFMATEVLGSIGAAAGDANPHGRASLYRFSKFDIRRLLRRAGVVFEDSFVFDEIRLSLQSFLQSAIRDTLSCADSRRSDIATVGDVVAARPGGLTMLGFGSATGVRHIWADMVIKVLKRVHPQLQIDPKALSVVTDANTFILELLLTKAAECRARQHSAGGPEMEVDESGVNIDDRALAFRDAGSGPLKGDDGAPLFSTRVYLDADLATPTHLQALDAKGLRLAAPVSCITPRDLQAALRLVVLEEFAQHAGCEADKATSKYSAGYSSMRESVPMHVSAGITNSPEFVSLVASRLGAAFPLTELAAVYAAAVMEYVTSQMLLEAGDQCKRCNGEVAGDEGIVCVLSCQHVSASLEVDDDLGTLFGSCIVREAGVVPFIDRSLLAEEEDGGEDEYDEDGELVEERPATFVGVMVAKARLAAKRAGRGRAVFVDPRTGLHMCARDETHDEYAHEGEFLEASPVPLLDALSRESQPERRRQAEAALTDEERALMRAEGFRIRQWDEENEDEDSWGREPLAHMHARHIEEVRCMQLSSDLLFPLTTFARYAGEVAHEVKKRDPPACFTAEALDCLQGCAEQYLVALCRDAQQWALRAGRMLVTMHDMWAARAVLGRSSGLRGAGITQQRLFRS